jgi:hypothetical protein
MPDVKINISISEQLKKRLENDKEFCKRLDGIANGQCVLFIKHCKINLDRCTGDNTWEEAKN